MVDQVEQISFALDIGDDGWPPVGLEWLHTSKTDTGLSIETLPLFVKDISVQDIIEAELDDENRVIRWAHIEKSKRSVVWIMAYGSYDPMEVLQSLRNVGCNTESLKSYNYYAVDVPSEISFEKIDAVLETLDKASSAVAFPSFRHE